MNLLPNSKYKTFFSFENLAVLGVYIGISLFIFRADFGNALFPKGTNVLDEFMTFYFWKQHGLQLWYPYTDWGQPYASFTGPNLLMIVVNTLSITYAIRIVEFSALVLAGMLSYISLRALRISRIASFISSLYYFLMAETPQFFEGHVPIMISFMFYPVCAVIIWKLIRMPSLKWSFSLALILYLMFSVGDFSALYMFLVFICPIAGYLLVIRVKENFYSRRELISLLYFAILFLAITISWWYPFILGARPEYTTNVTSHILDFHNVGFVSPLYTLPGLVADNSYSYFALDNFDYSISNSVYFYTIFLVIPALLIYYSIRQKNRKWFQLGVIYSIIFSLIATGNGIPVITQFNEFLYNYLPLFDFIPALERWSIFTVLINSFLLGYLIESLLNVRGTGSLKVKDAIKIKYYNKKLVSRVIILFIVSLILLQNAEMFTEPPTTFNFPTTQYSGFQYLNNLSESGYLAAFPLGAIYCRGSWSGVGQSSIFMAPYLTNRTTLVYQANNPYSLAIDNFIGYGETYGSTDNITKFLSSTNIRYISTNYYSNWSIISDSYFNPVSSYYGILNQTNLGSLIYNGTTQSVYELKNVSGELYFTSSYYLYYGGQNMLYDIMDEPFYNSHFALVNMSQITSGENNLIEYSSGIFIPYSEIQNNLQTINMANSMGIPVYVVSNLMGVNKTGNFTVVCDPFSAANKLSVNSDQNFSSFSLEFGSLSASLAQYNELRIFARAYISTNSSIEVSFSGKTDKFNGNGNDTSLVHSGTYTYRNYNSTFNIGNNRNVTFSLIGNNTINFVTAEFMNSSHTFSNVFITLNTPSSVAKAKFLLDAGSPGILVYTQIFNNLWSLNSTTNSTHLPVNIGLNGWLFTGKGNASGCIYYKGNLILGKSLIIEAIILPIVFFSPILISAFTILKKKKGKAKI